MGKLFGLKLKRFDGKAVLVRKLAGTGAFLKKSVAFIAGLGGTYGIYYMIWKSIWPEQMPEWLQFVAALAGMLGFIFLAKRIYRIVVKIIDRLLPQVSEDEIRKMDDGVQIELPHSPWRSMPLGIVAYVGGAIMIVIMGFAFYESLKMSGDIEGSIEFCAIWGFASMPFFYVGYLLRRPDPGDVLSEPEAPLVLYLRSFKSDGSMTRKRESAEELLIRVTAPFGTMIAIGAPAANLFPTLGASRLYLDDPNEWQQTVTQLRERSKLIVINVGEHATEGLMWELKHCIQSSEPLELLIHLEPDSVKLVEQTLRAIVPSFEGLPDKTRIVYFREKHEAVALVEKKITIRDELTLGINSVEAGVLRRILKPFYRERGVEVPKLRFTRREVGQMVPIAFLIGFVIEGIYNAFKKEPESTSSNQESEP